MALCLETPQKIYHGTAVTARRFAFDTLGNRFEQGCHRSRHGEERGGGLVAEECGEAGGEVSEHVPLLLAAGCNHREERLHEPATRAVGCSDRTA
jgi:hypothetical protein